MANEDRSWADPSVEEVSTGVFRIALPLPNDALRAVNVYALTDPSGLVLIDGGWAVSEAQEALDRALGILEYDLADVTQFLVTHVHRDHLTMALIVRRLFGSRITMGAGEKASLSELIAGDFEGPFRHMHLWGADELTEQALAALRSHPKNEEPYGLPDRWIIQQTELALGDRRLLAVPTPGHTSGHLVFADLDHRLLFAGDHILPHITPSIGFEPVRAAMPLLDYLASLALIQALPDLRLLPAHGPTTSSAHARTAELLDHHERRLTATAAAVGAGSRSAYSTARELVWTSGRRAFDQLDAFNRALAVGETAAHLDVLVVRGDAECESREGVAFYRRMIRSGELPPASI